MSTDLSVLRIEEWIQSRRDAMIEQVTEWASINTGTHNISGLKRLSSTLWELFDDLADESNRQSLPPEQVIDSNGMRQEIPLGDLLVFKKRPQAQKQILLGIHYDTVFGPESNFQEPERISESVLKGPGVNDAKGGLAVLLTTLKAVEKFLSTDRFGWTVFLNPDEERGSPGSGQYIESFASEADLGMVFEPANEDGSLISARKGSGFYTLVIRGEAGHAGEYPRRGSSAMHALSRFVSKLSELNDADRGLTANVGKIEGGGPANVVAELAIARFNLRAEDRDGEEWITNQLRGLLEELGNESGIEYSCYGEFDQSAKTFNEPMQSYFEILDDIGEQIDLDVDWKPSGGFSDGNIIQARGTPAVDSLGTVGRNIHSTDECLYVDSLTERALLSTLFLDSALNTL